MNGSVQNAIQLIPGYRNRSNEWSGRNDTFSIPREECITEMAHTPENWNGL